LGFWIRAALICLVALSAPGGCARTPPTTVAPHPPASLTVITWNMHRGDGDVQRLIDDIDSGRLSMPGEYILLLQEFGDRDDRRARVRSNARSLSVFFSPVRPNVANAIASTVPLENTRTIELPRERQPRSAAVATIATHGEQLFIVSVHLENRLAWYRGLFGDRARGRQANALLAALPSMGHGILGGDMNTMLGPQEPAWQTFVQRFPETPGHLEPTMRDRAVLDHLFVDLPDGWHLKRHVIGDRYGSDHHPLLGEISIDRP
jgi:endonuclease/exonuclease/phosphatase family metal-dependent hydrolase